MRMGSSSLVCLQKRPDHQLKRFLKTPGPMRKMCTSQHKNEDDQRRSRPMIRFQALFQQKRIPWSFRTGDRREAAILMPSRKPQRKHPAHGPARARRVCPRRRNRGKDGHPKPKRLSLMDISHPSNRQRARRWHFLWPIHL